MDTHSGDSVVSVCIEIPECIAIVYRSEASSRGVLQVGIANSCNYDTVVFLNVKDRMNNVIYNTYIELKASEEKRIEVPVGQVNQKITLSSEWSLKGTTLKLPLKEITIEL